VRQAQVKGLRNRDTPSCPSPSLILAPCLSCPCPPSSQSPRAALAPPARIPAHPSWSSHAPHRAASHHELMSSVLGLRAPPDLCFEEWGRGGPLLRRLRRRRARPNLVGHRHPQLTPRPAPFRQARVQTAGCPRRSNEDGTKTGWTDSHSGQMVSTESRPMRPEQRRTQHPSPPRQIWNAPFPSTSTQATNRLHWTVALSTRHLRRSVLTTPRMREPTARSTFTFASHFNLPLAPRTSLSGRCPPLEHPSAAAGRHCP